MTKCVTPGKGCIRPLSSDFAKKSMLHLDYALESVTTPSDVLISRDTFKQIVFHEYVMAFIIFFIHICSTMIKMKETENFYR